MASSRTTSKATKKAKAPAPATAADLAALAADLRAFVAAQPTTGTAAQARNRLVARCDALTEAARG